MEGIKVYVYGVLDQNDQIIYVGKTSTPSYRLPHHKKSMSVTVNKMKILDIFYDKENFWIHKLINEGHVLENKEISSTVEHYEIGDIVELKEQKKFIVRNIKTGEIFSSAYKACNSYKKIGYETFVNKLKQNAGITTKKFPEPFPFEIIQ